MSDRMDSTARDVSHHTSLCFLTYKTAAFGSKAIPKVCFVPIFEVFAYVTRYNLQERQSNSEAKSVHQALGSLAKQTVASNILQKYNP